MEDAVLRTIARLDGKPFPTTRGLVRGWVNGRLRRSTAAETVFCAELVAATYTAMGLLPGDRPLNAYDPGSFWSGDDLELLQGAQLGPEIPVDVPARPTERRPLRPRGTDPVGASAPCRPRERLGAHVLSGMSAGSSPNGVCPVPMSTGTRDSVRSAISPARRKVCTVRPPSTYTRR